ncbi:hypothetical protein PGT21_015646 [Puccinia graminis f. sp. tritici]|uniref:Uncharacterized protein n=1 Tax=Puccinia graminis f. sp. tritici TaxID=56615 RepID=A0A5B0NFE1_PUCGR|nr:hypothetical protein PGT21_015646 [Puccinia graminis f. sp. tritici]KAA1087957.1 hypothetical protein PGTUg99_009997 [Puccinia graminis f. sp. tritici]
MIETEADGKTARVEQDLESNRIERPLEYTSSSLINTLPNMIQMQRDLHTRLGRSTEPTIDGVALQVPSVEEIKKYCEEIKRYCPRPGSNWRSPDDSSEQMITLLSEGNMRPAL